MNAGNLRRDTPKGSAAGPARLGIPRFELAGRSAQPEQDAMLLRLLCFRSENRILEQSRETRHGRQGAAGQPLEEKTAMQQVLVRAALALRGGFQFRKYRNLNGGLRGGQSF